jgi:hypothetical protein
MRERNLSSEGRGWTLPAIETDSRTRLFAEAGKKILIDGHIRGSAARSGVNKEVPRFHSCYAISHKFNPSPENP